MQNEINRYDIATHELLTASESRHLATRTEIGEVKVVHTLFGKAKVRHVRTYHSRRLWSSVAVAGVGVLAVGLFLWKGIPQVSFPTEENALPPPMAVQATAPAPEMVPAPVVAPVPQPAPAVSANAAPAVAVAHHPDAPAVAQQSVAADINAQPMKTEPVRKAPERRIVAAKPEAAPAMGSQPQERKMEAKVAAPAPAVHAAQADAMNTAQPVKRNSTAAQVEPATGAETQALGAVPSESRTDQTKADQAKDEQANTQP